MINELEPVCASEDDRYGHHQSAEEPEPEEISASRRNSLFDKELFGGSFALPIRTAPSFQNSMPPAPAPPQRLLSRSSNGDLEQAPTACWEQHRFRPYHHVLMCGHEIDTAEIQACGSSCQPSSSAESKPKGPHILCLERSCVRSRMVQARRKANIFIPRKGKVPTRKSTPRAAKKTSGPMQTDEGDSLFLPEAVEAVQPAKATLRPRELANLRTDGTNALRYGTARRGRPSGVPGPDSQARTSESAKVVKQPYDFQGIGAMEQAKNTAYDVDTGMWSRSEEAHATMVVRQPGRVERDHSPGEKLPRNQVDRGDEEDEDEDASERFETQIGGVQPDGSYAAPELHCVCKSPHDSKMQQCEECERSFHLKCIRKRRLGLCRACEVSRAKDQRLARQKSGKGTQSSFLEKNRAAHARKRDFQKRQIELYGTPHEQVRRRVHGEKAAGMTDADSMDVDRDSV